MAMSIERFLRQVFQEGALEVRLPGGRSLTVGDGSTPGVIVRVDSPLWVARIAARPAVALGEAYMEGAVVFELGDIRDLIALAARNARHRPDEKRPGPLGRWWKNWTRARNDRIASRRNVAHHYDLSIDLYRLFLDEDLQYSCAYFEHPDATLDEAQAAKKRHIAAKLLLGPGQKVLDIGCGWGGMALSLAADADVRVDGVTLSVEQLQIAKARAEALGLSGRVDFSLTDYRDTTGPYDRIVSVGMFEHVGRPNYQAFFDKVAALLADDGVALIHSIGRSDGPNASDPWTSKYIFPGFTLPALSEIMPAVERAGLRVTDLEVLRLHYAETLAHWRRRFLANRDKALALYDERFCRMWDYYMAAAEMGFRYGGHMVFQIQLAKRVDAVPITRTYMEAAEQRLAMAEKSVA